MGIIFARFRKKVSTKEILEKIQKNIGELEEYKENTEQRGRKLVGSLVIYSFIFNFIAAIICYFYYLPPTIKEKLLYATPFIGFIILINLIKTYLTWYYGWKVRRNEKKLLLLKDQKKKLLEDVMEMETYKVAKDILETFAPEQLKKTVIIQSPPSTPINQKMGTRMEGSEVRRRIVSTPQNSQLMQPPSQRFTRPLVQVPSTPAPMTRFGPGVRAASPPTNLVVQTPFSANSSRRQGEYDCGVPPGPPMPRPVLPRERGILDRFVEYLVGDGPSNRYALVCKQCESHNGMALKEEFPYIAFRCAYCHYWNPSRKQKPAAPKLETVPAEILAKKLANEKESSEEEEETETSETESNSSSKSSSTSGSDLILSLDNILNRPNQLDVSTVMDTKLSQECKAEVPSSNESSAQSGSSSPVMNETSEESSPKESPSLDHKDSQSQESN